VGGLVIDFAIKPLSASKFLGLPVTVFNCCSLASKVLKARTDTNYDAGLETMLKLRAFYFTLRDSSGMLYLLFTLGEVLP
jgi:hypothetical protein